MGRRMRGEDIGQGRMQRDFEGSAGLLLSDRDEPRHGHAGAHADDVGTPLPGVEQQTEG